VAFFGTCPQPAVEPSPPAARSRRTKPNSVFNRSAHRLAFTYRYAAWANPAEASSKALLDDGLSEGGVMNGPFQTVSPGIGGRGANRKKDGPWMRATPAGRPEAEREGGNGQVRGARKKVQRPGSTFTSTSWVLAHRTRISNSLSRGAKANRLGFGVTTERNEPLARRVAPFADKHKIWVGSTITRGATFRAMAKGGPIPSSSSAPPSLFNSRHSALTFAGSKGLSPIPVLENIHDRIVSLQSPKTGPGPMAGNVGPWGTRGARTRSSGSATQLPGEGGSGDVFQLRSSWKYKISRMGLQRRRGSGHIASSIAKPALA